MRSPVPSCGCGSAPPLTHRAPHGPELYSHGERRRGPGPSVLAVPSGYAIPRARLAGTDGTCGTTIDDAGALAARRGPWQAPASGGEATLGWFGHQSSSP